MEQGKSELPPRQREERKEKVEGEVAPMPHALEAPMPPQPEVKSKAPEPAIPAETKSVVQITGLGKSDRSGRARQEIFNLARKSFGKRPEIEAGDLEKALKVLSENK